MKEILIAVLTVFILAILFAIPTMILWNAVIPDVLGVSKINFEQAVCITLLSRCLFDGFSGSKKE